MTNYEFINNCKKLIGTPYSKCDCIGVIRKAAGISCQGTNWLWRSINNYEVYRYLVKRSIDMIHIPAGAIVFKCKWGKIPTGYKDMPDCYHVGVVMEDGRVLHSSPSTGVRIASLASEWDAWGLLKMVSYDEINNDNNYYENINETLDELLSFFTEISVIMHKMEDKINAIR